VAASHEYLGDVMSTSQTVGTKAYGHFVSDDNGRLIGLAYHPRDLSGEEAANKAAENARKWAAADDLIEALNYLLGQTVDKDLAHGIELGGGEQDARTKALAAIERATVAATVKAAATITATMATVME